MDIHWFHAPTSSPVGTVIVAHGYAEHHGRFMPLINGLTARGFDVATYDHAGHGTSPGKRANVDVGRLILDHIDQRRTITTQSRSHNIFLFGHSMGGLITAASTILEPAPIAGTVLSAPAFIPQPALPTALSKALLPIARIFPSLPAARMKDGILAHDPAVEQAFRNDPLNYTGPVPLRTAATMIQQGQKTLENAHMLRTPMLILHGTEDELTDPKGSMDFVTRVESTHENADIQLGLVTGSRHEILNETGGEKLITLIADWMIDRATPSTQTHTLA